MTPVPVAELRSRLLGWYDASRRDLPWRAAPGTLGDPYRVWLSEVMLQQTRVETVKPYFERWLERFPTLETLSEAPRDDVLKAWEGLGYYSRARNFHRAVSEVVERYGGRVPDEADSFRALPGVGRYTAGAVLSIAFGRNEPVVDGNVRRVFARLLDRAEPAEAELWSLAERLVEGDRPGDLNQALMELGAIVCTPRSPSCDACPVTVMCAAHAAGTQPERPARRKRAPLPLEEHAVAVVRHGEELLLVRRPDEGRLGGMWEFPGAVMRAGETLEDGAARAAAEWTGMRIAGLRSLGTVEHVFTHVRVSYRAVLAELAAEPLQPRAGIRWVVRDRLEELALPRAQQRIAGLFFG
ncbi:MAG: A/G-specific adenine glycosylase [Gemmatimonadota bacterium]